MDNIVAQMICCMVTAFRDGTRQFKDLGNGFKPHLALKFRFATKVNYDVEDGYRYLDIIVWQKSNYIGVFLQEDWSVIKNGEEDYNDGSTELKCYSYHHSCWRQDGISRILFEYRDKITCLGGNQYDSFCEVIELSPEKQEELQNIINPRRKS